MKYILSIDQSTSGTKGLVFNNAGKLLSRADVPHRQITNEQGWVEHDPEEIYANVLRAARLAIQKADLSPADISVVGISNQRETAVCWDQITGKPFYNAIVWQCGRATDVTAEVKEMGLEEEVKKKTGLNLSPFFSAAKFGWIVRHVPEAKQALDRKILCCGTIDAWLVFKLTGNFKTDYSNASRTQLLNLDTLKWDADLIRAFGLSGACMPEICMSDSLFGKSTFEGLFPCALPIHCVLGDSHAALFGNCCLKPGMAKVTYGTGSSIMLNAGTTRPAEAKGVVTSIAWGMNKTISYAIEGNINYAGAVTKWLVEDVELLDNIKDAGRIAAMAKNTNGVYLVPAFSGMGAPYFDSSVRAAFVGMNRNTKRAHLVRASEECIAYQITDVVEAINSAVSTPLNEICVDGGLTRDEFLMQFQADMLGVPLKISNVEELSGAGVAYCAAIASQSADVENLFVKNAHMQLSPKMEWHERNQLYSGWKAAIALLVGNK